MEAKPEISRLPPWPKIDGRCAGCGKMECDGYCTQPFVMASREPQPQQTSQVAKFFAAFEGKKTYIVVIVALIYLFGGDQGWWVLNESILAMLGFGGMAALRSGGQKKKG